jgi:hypothetical protein
MHCNYDITWGGIANKNSCCNEVTMWLSHDSSSEYALDIGVIRVYYASIYNWNSRNNVFHVPQPHKYTCVIIYLCFFRTEKKLFAIGTYNFKYTYSNLRISKFMDFHQGLFSPRKVHRGNWKTSYIIICRIQTWWIWLGWYSTQFHKAYFATLCSIRRFVLKLSTQSVGNCAFLRYDFWG